MNRYNRITEKHPREIVLLRSHPCRWGRCFFCDYITDNSTDESSMVIENQQVLQQVTGDLKSLEVINSASVFELPKQTLEDIRQVVVDKGITHLNFEAYYSYRHRLQEIRDFFPTCHVTFKCGVETFDDAFRNDYLNKGLHYDSPEEVASYFDTICLLVGIQGQTPAMIDRDMSLLQQYFKRGCINIFVNNSTPVKRDDAIVAYFRDNYGHLDKNPNIEILWNNTDFGVGE